VLVALHTVEAKIERLGFVELEKLRHQLDKRLSICCRNDAVWLFLTLR
jgi:hypothetical protein